MRHPLIICILLGMGGIRPNPAAQIPLPPVAVKFLALFDRLRAEEVKPPATRGHLRFQLSGDEINQYLQYSLRATPRPGVESVQVKVFPGNYVSTFSVVDFDAVERWKPGTIPALLRPALHGRKTVWLDVRFQAAGGRATFSVEKAYFQDIRLPAFFVEKMIQVVAARQPEHYDTSKPVPLPFGLRRVWTASRELYGEN